MSRNHHVTPTQNTQSYASLLHNSGPSFLNICVARPRVIRKLWTADNRCGWSIVHLKNESNKSVFLLEEPLKTKKGCQTDGQQRGYVKGRHPETVQHKTSKLQPVCYRALHDSECPNCREFYKKTSNSHAL
ncbi:hypothetical protein TNCV_843911 [Trichonephila clavipes]|nr:hypothetical protein TNCV_843911 [Trichonephila clavipes]